MGHAHCVGFLDNFVTGTLSVNDITPNSAQDRMMPIRHLFDGTDYNTRLDEFFSDMML